jgi:hypothetical protein
MTLVTAGCPFHGPESLVCPLELEPCLLDRVGRVLERPTCASFGVLCLPKAPASVVTDRGRGEKLLLGLFARFCVTRPLRARPPSRRRRVGGDDVPPGCGQRLGEAAPSEKLPPVLRERRSPQRLGHGAQRLLRRPPSEDLPRADEKRVERSALMLVCRTTARLPGALLLEQPVSRVQEEIDIAPPRSRQLVDNPRGKNRLAKSAERLGALAVTALTKFTREAVPRGSELFERESVERVDVSYLDQP